MIYGIPQHLVELALPCVSIIVLVVLLVKERAALRAYNLENKRIGDEVEVKRLEYEHLTLNPPMPNVLEHPDVVRAKLHLEEVAMLIKERTAARQLIAQLTCDAMELIAAQERSAAFSRKDAPSEPESSTRPTFHSLFNLRDAHTTHEVRPAYDSAPILRALEISISNIRQGGTSQHQIQHQTHEKEEE